MIKSEYCSAIKKKKRHGLTSKHWTKGMKPDIYDYILDDSVYMKLLEKIKLKRRKVNWCLSWAGGQSRDWLQMNEGTFGVIIF